MHRRVLAIAGCCVVALVAGGGAPAKGDGPRVLAAGYGSVWVGFGTGEVLEVDARRSSIQRRWLSGNAPGGSVHALVTANGAVWVAAGKGIQRINPRTRRAHRPIDTVRPFQLAAGAGSIWAGNDHGTILRRVDPRSRRVVATISVPGQLARIAAGPGGAVILRVPTPEAGLSRGGPRVLHRVDSRTNRLVEPGFVLGCDHTIAVGRDFVWTSDVCSGRLDRRDPRTLRSTGSLVTTFDPRIVLAFGSVWLIGRHNIRRVDPGSLRVIATINVVALSAAADDKALWLLLGDSLLRLDPSTNRVVGREIRIPP